MKEYMAFLEEMPVGLAVCDKRGKLLQYNKRLAGILETGDCDVLSGKLGAIRDKIQRARAARGNETTWERGDGRVFSVLLHESVSRDYLYFKEEDIGAALMDEIAKIDALNHELRELFGTCTNDTVWITDGEGNTLVAGKQNAIHLGVDVGELEGKNVRDLVRNRLFYPSVTLKVMERGCREVVLQRTRTGRQCVAVGIPCYDGNGNLSRIVSYSRDISRQMRVGNLLAATGNLDGSNQEEGTLRKLITANEEILSFLQLVKIVAATDSTVLISGETGSGKGVVASLIHQMSRRADKVFLQINCGAISSEILNAELFGYTPGTFTGALQAGKKGIIEAADGGTLFLDEIAELPLDQQMKLLEVLQEKSIMRVGGRKKIPVNVRFVAATNKDLEELVKQGRFREDLFYRLNVVPFHIPALRRRREDIPLLVRHFSKNMEERLGYRKIFSQEALNALQQYDWPGNVRELEHLVERLYVALPKSVVALQDLPPFLPSFAPPPRNAVEVKRIVPLRRCAEMVTMKLLKLAASRYATEEEIAGALGCSQSKVSRGMARYGIKIAKKGSGHA